MLLDNNYISYDNAHDIDCQHVHIKFNFNGGLTMSHGTSPYSIRKSDANDSLLLRTFSEYDGAFPEDADDADLLPRNLCVKAVRLA